MSEELKELKERVEELEKCFDLMLKAYEGNIKHHRFQNLILFIINVMLVLLVIFGK